MIHVEKLPGDVKIKFIFVKNQDIIAVCKDAIYSFNSNAMEWILYAKYPDMGGSEVWDFEYTPVAYNQSSQQLYIATQKSLNELKFSKNSNTQQNVYVLKKSEDFEDLKEPRTSFKIIIHCNQEILEHIIDGNECNWNDDDYSALFEAVRKRFNLNKVCLYRKVRGDGIHKYYIISRYYIDELYDLQEIVRGRNTLHLQAEEYEDEDYDKMDVDDEFKALYNLQMTEARGHPRYCSDCSSLIAINDEVHIFANQNGTGRSFDDDFVEYLDVNHYMWSGTMSKLDKVKFVADCGTLQQSQIICTERQKKMFLFGEWIRYVDGGNANWVNHYFCFKTKAWNKLPQTAQFPNDTVLAHIQCALTRDQENIIVVTNIGLIYVLNLDTLVFKKSCLKISKFAQFHICILSSQQQARNIIEGYILAFYKKYETFPLEIIDNIQLFYQFSYVHLFHETDHWKMSVDQLLKCE
eukprot:214973_1